MSEENGWIKLHRQVLDSPVVMKDAAHMAVWLWLLLHATHKPHDTLFGGKRITLQPGQLITGRREMARELRLSASRINRIISEFKIEQQIEQRSTPYGSLFSIVNWHKYQDSGPQNGPRSDHKRTTSGPRADTIQECKNDKEVVVDARARTRGTAAALSDRLSDEEWHRLDRQFDEFLDLIDRIDDQVQDPYGIDNPYAYFLRAANNLNWPRK